MASEIELDVSALEPPEPLRAILATVGELAPGQSLRVRHRREPFPLYAALQELGFVHRTVREGPERYTILIWRAGDEVAQGRCGQPDAPPGRAGEARR